MASATAVFTVDCEGEMTGEKWHGSFTTKLLLSHSELFRQDEIRRKLLGENPEFANAATKNRAEVFSYIIIHLTDAANWWKNSNNGQDLEDDTPVAKVYEGIVSEVAKFHEARKAKAEAAVAALKQIEPKQA